MSHLFFSPSYTWAARLEKRVNAGCRPSIPSAQHPKNTVRIDSRYDSIERTEYSMIGSNAASNTVLAIKISAASAQICAFMGQPIQSLWQM